MLQNMTYEINWTKIILRITMKLLYVKATSLFCASGMVTVEVTAAAVKVLVLPPKVCLRLQVRTIESSLKKTCPKSIREDQL